MYCAWMMFGLIEGRCLDGSMIRYLNGWKDGWMDG